MTAQEIIKKIRAEVERLKGICTAQIEANPGQTFPFVMEMTGYDKLLSFLSDLEKECEEKPNDQWDEAEGVQTRFAFYTYKDDPSVLYLSNVFVEEASRNHGFGTRILKAAEKAAEAIGATSICLRVKQGSPANAWYRKHGYGYVTFEDGYDWLEKTIEL